MRKRLKIFLAAGFALVLCLLVWVGLNSARRQEDLSNAKLRAIAKQTKNWQPLSLKLEAFAPNRHASGRRPYEDHLLRQNVAKAFRFFYAQVEPDVHIMSTEIDSTTLRIEVWAPKEAWYAAANENGPPPVPTSEQTENAFLVLDDISASDKKLKVLRDAGFEHVELQSGYQHLYYKVTDHGLTPEH